MTKRNRKRKVTDVLRRFEIDDWAKDSSLLHLTNHEYGEHAYQEEDQFFHSTPELFSSDLVNHAWAGLICLDAMPRRVGVL